MSGFLGVNKIIMEKVIVALVILKVKNTQNITKLINISMENIEKCRYMLYAEYGLLYLEGW